MNKELNVFTLRMLRDQYEAEHMDTEVEALDEAISALDISGTNGVFIPGITVEELRSATFMGVKMLLANGCIYDVSFPLAQPDIARDIATIIENEKDMRVIMREAEHERKKGAWMWRADYDGSRCSECGYACSAIEFRTDGPIRSLWNFCPHCGCEMCQEGENHEQHAR